MSEVDEVLTKQKPAVVVHTPHDSAFKIAFHELRVAHDFIVRYVPEEIINCVDMTTLRRCSENFVDRALRKTEADVVYCANFKKGNELSELQLIYFIIEHQSTPDRLVPLRFCNYGFRTIDGHRREYPKSKLLPMVVTMVLYNGKKQYPYSTVLGDLFGERKQLALKFFVGMFQPILVDLTKSDNRDIKTHGFLGLIEFVLKNSGTMDALELLKEAWPSLIRPLPEDSDYTAGMVKYVISQGDIKDVPAFMEEVRTLFSSSLKESVMGFAEYFTQQGIQQGVQQGVQLGAHQNQKKTILVLLKKTNDLGKVAELLELTPDEVKRALDDE